MVVSVPNGDTMISERIVPGSRLVIQNKDFPADLIVLGVDRTKTHIQIYMTLSPKDYCLIPGNFAIKFVEA